MASLTPKADTIRLKTDNLPPGDVSGIILMSSPKANGVLTISFSEAVILHIAQNMLGQSYDQINAEIADLVGELTNMVTGGAKRLLESKGYDFDMATPKIICGKDKPFSHLENQTNVIVVPFNTPAGDFYVEICFKHNKKVQ